MKKIRVLKRGFILFFAFAFLAQLNAQSARQWTQFLSGVQLTYYDGSVVSNNSSLVIIDLCVSGTFSYRVDAGWYNSGGSHGASNSAKRGKWEIMEYRGQIYIKYHTWEGIFHDPIYLQQNGRVNIGGRAYAIQRGGAACR